MSIVPAHIVDAFNGNEKAAELALYQQASIWMTGHDATEQIKGTVSMKDAMALQNASVLIPHVLTRYVLEGIEPMLVGTRLLTRIPYKPGLTIQFPAMGALFAQDVATRAAAAGSAGRAALRLVDGLLIDPTTGEVLP